MTASSAKPKEESTPVLRVWWEWFPCRFITKHCGYSFLFVSDITSLQLGFIDQTWRILDVWQSVFIYSVSFLSPLVPAGHVSTGSNTSLFLILLIWLNSQVTAVISLWHDYLATSLTFSPAHIFSLFKILTGWEYFIYSSDGSFWLKTYFDLFPFPHIFQ